MEMYYGIIFFLLGTIFGSFFCVVGTRLPNGESIVFPPSHCTSCGHKLRFFELIPVFSYLMQKGRCTKCKCKLSLKYPLYEICTGLLFCLCYLSFGITLELLLALTFVSSLLIVIISDIDSYIIPDEVILCSSILMIIEIFCIYGFRATYMHLINGVLSFLIMYLTKCLGDFLFKKESMGGGDIKLLFLIGLVIGFKMSVVTIFFSSFIGLPVSIFILYIKKTNIIPFGPFLSVAAIILFLCRIDLDMLLKLWLS